MASPYPRLPKEPHLCGANSFNKREHDFPDLQTYNNYLEEVEDISMSPLYWLCPPLNIFHSF